MSEPTAAQHPMRVAFAARDFEGLAATLAPDVVMRSPIVSLVAFRGREQVAGVLEVVRGTVSDLSYVHDFGDGERHVLVFRGRAALRRIEGVDILLHDEQGLVREITVYLRPLGSLLAFAAVIVPRVALSRLVRLWR